MKNTFKILSVAALMGAGMASMGVAQAQNVDKSTVIFNGKVQGATCSIVAASRDQVVTLPPVSTKALAVRGDMAGQVAFSIQVENCDASVTGVGANFLLTNVDPLGTDVGLKNDAAPIPANGGNPAVQPAQNVLVQVYSNTGRQLLGAFDTARDFVPVVSSKATLTYKGGYFATGQSTVGPVKATAHYVLAYQ